ncbi:hypothetical protein P5V15_002748 [Pogonomyrmex californicus]
MCVCARARAYSGPFKMLVRLTGEFFIDFITNNLVDLMNDMPLHQQQNILFQYDGAPHNFRNARRISNINFPEKWIGCGGPISWPARSLDF